MSEVIDRHVSVGVEVSKSLYMDCGCCSGKVGSTGDTGTSIAALSCSTLSVPLLFPISKRLSVKLDGMHLMLRIGQEMNTKHPYCKKFF